MSELPVNTAFSLAVPGLQLAWDSVSLGALKKCPRYYQLAIVEGWQPREKSFHLDFGIWAHSSRERYYHAKAAGASHDDAVDAAVDYLLKATWDRGLQRPWISGDSNKNRYTLLRSMVWYLDHWEHDPLETVMLSNGKPAVELSFRYETTYASTLTNSPEPFLLCGHLDRVATLNDLAYLSDLKTTKSTLGPWYFAQFTPDNQFSLYSYSGKVVFTLPLHGLIVDAMQVAVGFTRFERAPVARTPDQLDEWYRDFGQWLEVAQLYAARGVWPMNEKACFNCDFRSICARSPGGREMWLKADFTRRVWDPLVSRGEI